MQQAIKYDQVTAHLFWSVNDVIEYTGYKRSKCYKMMREFNELRKAAGKAVMPGKVRAKEFADWIG